MMPAASAIRRAAAAARFRAESRIVFRELETVRAAPAPICWTNVAHAFQVLGVESSHAISTWGDMVKPARLSNGPQLETQSSMK